MSVKRLGNKKYQIRISVPLGNGKYKKYNFVRIFDSIEEARSFELDFKNKFNPDSIKFEKKSFTLEEFIDEYNGYMENQIKSSTKQSNIYASKNFIPLYSESVNGITSKQIKKITDELFNAGRSEHYVNKVLTYANKLYNWGLEMGYVNYNPVKRIPKYKRPDNIKQDEDFYTPEEFERFIESFPRNVETGEYTCYVIVNVLYFLGLRYGECVALTRKDINMKKGTVRINKTVSRYVLGKSYAVTAPKTKNSIRTIKMPKRLKGIMKEYLAYYNQIYGVTDETFLFGVERPVLAKVVRKRILKACESSGVKRIKIHGFRRSNASLLCNSGAPVSVVAKRLGHTQNECLKTYVQFFESNEDELIDVIDRRFD